MIIHKAMVGLLNHFFLDVSECHLFWVHPYVVMVSFVLFVPSLLFGPNVLFLPGFDSKSIYITHLHIPIDFLFHYEKLLLQSANKTSTIHHYIC